jgi:hypothetical protein
LKKSVSFVLLAVILLQSCVVYQQTSVPLDGAVDRGKVKLVNTSGNEFRFKNMYIKDSIYYGDSKSQEIRIDTTEIKNIYLKDRKKSIKRTVLIALSPLIVYGAYIVIVIIFFF